MNVPEQMTTFVPQHIAILAGGTGGHIMPGLAVADELAARGHRISWLGSSKGMEAKLVPERGYLFHGLQISGLRGKGVGRWLQMPFRLTRSVLSARDLLRDLQPSSVLSMGGFAAGPGGLAAYVSGIPLIVHEQNRRPGLTNKVLARIARIVCQGFADSFPAGLQAMTIGNPVRDACLHQAPPEQRYAQRQQEPLHVLVLGGSQGARALNKYLPQQLASTGITALHIRHQCGAGWEAECQASYATTGLTVDVEPFIDDMASAYAWSDLVIARSGAMTVSELAAVGVASLLVPFPFAVDDHQTANAQVLAEAGAASIMTETELQQPAATEQLQALLGQREQLLTMAQAAQQLQARQATRALADICLQAAGA